VDFFGDVNEDWRASTAHGNKNMVSMPFLAIWILANFKNKPAQAKARAVE